MWHSFLLRVWDKNLSLIWTECHCCREVKCKTWQVFKIIRGINSIKGSLRLLWLCKDYKVPMTNSLRFFSISCSFFCLLKLCQKDGHLGHYLYVFPLKKHCFSYVNCHYLETKFNHLLFFSKNKLSSNGNISWTLVFWAMFHVLDKVSLRLVFLCFLKCVLLAFLGVSGKFSRLDAPERGVE